MLPPKLAKPKKADKRLRSPAHLKWVRSHHCSVPGCDRVPIEAAHVRTGTDGGMGMKPSDRWVISLCQHHHSEQHRIGEPEFEKRHAIDMKRVAETFYRHSPKFLEMERKQKEIDDA